MRLKATFTLPYGYAVKTKVLPKSRFEKAGGGTNDYAFWCSARQIIFLRAERQDADRWLDYLHELDHMWVDYKEWLHHQAAAKP